MNPVDMLWGLLRFLGGAGGVLLALFLGFLLLRDWRCRKAPETTHASRERAGHPIRAYCGLNGSGKTLLAVRDLIPVLDGKTWRDPVSGREGERLVWSNVRLLAEEPAATREEAAAAWAAYGLGPCRDPYRLPHPRYRPLTDWRQFFQRGPDGHWLVEHASVLLDEVTSVANSRDSGKMAREVADLLVMLRKRDVESIWTGTSFQRADVIIRETTYAATLCEGRRPDYKHNGDTGWAWKPNRCVVAKTYDVSALEEFHAQQTAESRQKRFRLRPAVRERYWRPTHRAHAMYDTWDAVTVLSQADAGGRCIHCRGKKRDFFCEGHNGAEVIDTVVHLQPPTITRPAFQVETSEFGEGGDSTAVGLPGAEQRVAGSATEEPDRYLATVVAP